ncbi:MAG: restriction endonuclease subunit S [Shimia thalassica]|uniref:restriction endonuclease subunit S n=1 Tax=Shimia thalassica TaxID=1715693 RepID=UPI00329872E0
MIPTTDVVSNGTPAGWRTVPFWSLFRREKKTGFPDEELLSVYRDYGVIPKSSRDDNHNKESEDLSGYQLVTEGALVTNKMKAWQGSIAVSRYHGIVSPAYYVYTPQSDECDQFLHYLLRSDPYIGLYGRISKGVRVNQWDLEHEALRNIPVLLPDLATQRQIADFLDRETARIDLLIEKKQRLVALLGERQKVLVEELLGGVDASHVHRLKFAIRRIEQGWSPQCEDVKVEGERWGVLKLGAITTGVYLEEQHKALPEVIEPIPSLRVRVGDVLVARASGSPKLVGKAAFVETSNLNLMLSDKHFRLVPNLRKVLPEYLAVVINSGKSRNQIEDRLSSAEGMARNIGQSVIYGLRCPFPPIAAQQKILNAVRSSRAITDALVFNSVASIDRLKEYRSALITAAVTGQIDVTTYAKSGTPDRRLDAIQEEMSA